MKHLLILTPLLLSACLTSPAIKDTRPNPINMSCRELSFEHRDLKAALESHDQLQMVSAGLDLFVVVMGGQPTSQPGESIDVTLNRVRLGHIEQAINQKKCSFNSYKG